MDTLFTSLACYLLGILSYKILLSISKKEIGDKASKILHSAELNAKKINEEAKEAARDRKNQVEAELSQEKRALLKQKEAIKKSQEALDKQKIKQRSLEEVANLSMHDAKKKIMDEAEKACRQKINKMVMEKENEAESTAKAYLIHAMQKMPDAVIDTTYKTIEKVSEKDKAKIIGPQGKNIDCFKRHFQVDLLIDATSTITLSSFHFERLETAHSGLVALLHSGKINPETIENAYHDAKKALEKRLMHYGQEALDILEIDSMDPKLISQIGKMRMQKTNGQNLYTHSLEVACMMKEISRLLDLDETLASKIGLLHDIGKTLTVETGLDHSTAGAQFVRECDESETIAAAINDHHTPEKISIQEAKLLKPADTLSSIRKGARK